MIKLLPTLVERLLKEAPHVRLRVLQLEAEHLESWLESGKVDFAMGSFPALTKGIRRQPLWVERYVSVVRDGHPRIVAEPTLRAFAREKHVLVSIPAPATRIRLAERAIEAAVPAENIICRVPMFISAAMLAKHTDAVATLPLSIATVLARRPRPEDHHAADQAAEDRDLPVLARPVPPRAGQQMDPLGVRLAVSQGGCDVLRRGRAAASAIPENTSGSRTTAPGTGSPAAARGFRPA